MEPFLSQVFLGHKAVDLHHNTAIMIVQNNQQKVQTNYNSED